jgi:hypothetical protein
VSAGIFNLVDQNAIEQGSDFSFSFIYNDVNGNPVDLSATSLTGAIKKDYNTNPVANFTLSTSTLTGYVGVSIAGATTGSIAPDRYRYDILAANSTSTKHLLKGFVDVVESITLP